MLKQLGQVYSVMKIERLRKLVPFMGFGRVEAIIVDAVKNEYIQVCITATLTLPRHSTDWGHPYGCCQL